MNELEIMQRSLPEMHQLLDKAIEGMTADQLNFRPSEGGVSAFFSLWHYVRTEDNIVNFVIQRRNTVWLEHGYDQRLQLPRTSQGTGMTDAEAGAIRLNDMDAWRAYQAATWKASTDYLATMDATEFESRRVTIKPVGEMSLWQALWGMCLSHGYRHVGEIEYARGVQGLGGLTI